MDKLKALITTFQAKNLPIFLTGDFNVNYRLDSLYKDPLFPYANMSAVGVQSSYESLNLASIASSQGTFNGSNRLIDYLFHWDRADVTIDSERISLSTHGSDHYGYYSTATLR
jgi:hypothetical protein